MPPPVVPLEKAKSVEELYTLPNKKKRTSEVTEASTNKENLTKGVKRKTSNPPMGLMAATMMKKHKSLDCLLGFSPNAPIPAQSPGVCKVKSTKVFKGGEGEVKMDNILPKEAEYVYMKVLNAQTPTFL